METWTPRPILAARMARKTQTPPKSFEDALRHYEEAEKVRPQGNDDALLRWNRCLRLMQGIPDLGKETEAFEADDAPPIFRD